MVTALSLMRGAPSSAPLDLDSRVGPLARWLAHQRAVPVHQVESTALEIASLPDALEGPKAPFVVQPRGGLWLVGKLGGRALLHIFPDQEAASQRGRELAEEAKVSLLVVGQGGEVTRWRAEPTEPVPAAVTPLHQAPKPVAPAPATTVTTAPKPVEAAPTPMVTTAPPVPTPPKPVEAAPAPAAASVVATPSPAPTTEPASASPAEVTLPLEVRHHATGWAVMLRGRVIATAPTREKARLRRKALLADPDFLNAPEPQTDHDGD